MGLGFDELLDLGSQFSGQFRVLHEVVVIKKKDQLMYYWLDIEKIVSINKTVYSY